MGLWCWSAGSSASAPCEQRDTVKPPSFSKAPQLPSPPGLSGFSFEHNKDEGPINLGEVRQVLKHRLGSDLFLWVTTNNSTSTTNGTNVFTEIRVFQVKSFL